VKPVLGQEEQKDGTDVDIVVGTVVDIVVGTVVDIVVGTVVCPKCLHYILYNQSQKNGGKPFRGNLSFPRFPRKQTEKERKKNSFRGNRRKRKGKKILSAETDGKGKKKIIASASREETE